jgi:hypothetical protein
LNAARQIVREQLAAMDPSFFSALGAT